MDKSVTKLGRLGMVDDNGFVPGSPSSRLALVWPLTQELTSLSKKYDAKRRLQRNVAVVSRRER